MVVASVKEAKEYYQERWDRQVRVGLSILGVFGSLQAAYSLLGPSMVAEPLPWVIGAGVAMVAAAVAAVRYLWRRESRSPRREPIRNEGPQLLTFPTNDREAA
jgi:hypothetical protein